MTAENERSERKSVNFKSRISFQVIWASWDSLPGLPYRICVRKGVESDILSSMTQKRKSTSKVYVNCLLVHWNGSESELLGPDEMLPWNFLLWAPAFTLATLPPSPSILIPSSVKWPTVSIHSIAPTGTLAHAKNAIAETFHYCWNGCIQAHVKKRSFAKYLYTGIKRQGYNECERILGSWNDSLLDRLQKILARRQKKWDAEFPEADAQKPHVPGHPWQLSAE